MDVDHYDYKTGNALKRYAEAKATIQAAGVPFEELHFAGQRRREIRVDGGAAYIMTYPIDDRDIDLACEWMLEKFRAVRTIPMVPPPSPSVVSMLELLEGNREDISQLVRQELTVIQTERLMAAKGNPFKRIPGDADRIVDAVIEGFK